MREMREYFDWFIGDVGKVIANDLEDLHDLDDLSPVASVEYVVDYLWHSYNFPSVDGKIYVNDYIDWEDLSFGATLRVRYTQLVGFSEEELNAIHAELNQRGS